MSYDNWLAEELNKDKKGREWVYIGTAVSTCLLIGLVVIIIISVTNNKGDKLANTQSNGVATNTGQINLPSTTKTDSPQASSSTSKSSSTNDSSIDSEISALNQGENQQALEQVQAEEQERCNTATSQYNSSLQSSADTLISEEKGIASDLQNNPLLSFSAELIILNEEISTANQSNLTLLYNEDEGIIKANSCSQNLPDLGQIPECIANDYMDIGDCESQVYPALGLS